MGFALALQAGLAAALAWFVAHDVIGRPAPFFAPIAAVITLASSVGQRAKRTIELVVGVAIGIGIGDAIILLIGTGPWQIGLWCCWRSWSRQRSAGVRPWSCSRRRPRCWWPR